MSELSPEAQALVDAVRSDGPRAGLQAALKAGIVTKAASVAGTAGTTAVVTSATAVKIGSVAAVAAVAVWVAVAQLNSEPVEQKDTSDRATLVAPAPEQVGDPEPSPIEVAPIAEIKVAEPKAAAEQQPARRQADTRKSQAPRPTALQAAPEPVVAPPDGEAPSEPALDSSLAAETRLLKGMRSALAAANWQRARFLAQAHAQQFPEGLLTAERLVVTARAACAQDDKEAARAARAELVRRLPGSAYVADVDKYCSNTR